MNCIIIFVSISMSFKTFNYNLKFYDLDMMLKVGIVVEFDKTLFEDDEPNNVQ